MPFAAFLMKPEPGAAPLLEIVLHPERNDRTDAGEGVAHQPEQGAVTEADARTKEAEELRYRVEAEVEGRRSKN